jgi:signal transduction histidine kinase/DNA-binding NarL/FixJ family response regulator
MDKWLKKKIVGYNLLAAVICLLSPFFITAQTVDLTTPDAEVYNLSDGFSTNCFQRSFQDTNGLIWLKTCPFVGWNYNHHFTTFDGHQTIIPELSGDKFEDGTVTYALGMTLYGLIYGVYASESKKENGLFFLDTDNRSLKLERSNSIHSNGIPIVSCQREGDELILLFANLESIEIGRYSLKSNSYRTIFSKEVDLQATKRSPFCKDPFQGAFLSASYIYQHEGSYLFIAGSPPIFKLDEESLDLSIIGEDELGSPYLAYMEDPRHPPVLFMSDSTELSLIFPHTSKGSYTYDFANDQFSISEELSALSLNERIGISKSDSKLHFPLVRGVKENSSRFNNFLINRGAELLPVPPEVKQVYHIANLRQSDNILICTDAGIYILKDKSNNPVTAHAMEAPLRSMMAIGSDKIILNLNALGKGIGVFHVEDDSLQVDYFDSQFASLGGSEFKRRKDGKIWIPGSETIGLIDIGNKKIQEYESPFTNFERYELLNDSTLILMYQGVVYSWLPETGITQVLYEDEAISKNVGYLHEFYRHSNRSYYVAIGEGLLELSADFKTHQIYGLDIERRPIRILCIDEDPEGRLWLGTYANGVQLFDPIDKSFKSLKIVDGLLSNTVAGLLQDGDGSIWASTFNGISQISIDSFEVLTTLTDEDGLANNESNRFSSCLLPDGKLAFGSIAGFSMIDPTFYSNNNNKRTAPQIYLTKSSWFHNQAKVDTTFYGLPSEDIVLSASERSLVLDLALTDYIQPDKQKFSYQIDDQPWQFVGSNQRLYLNGLPAGEYEIKIKGIDYLGTESSNVVIVPVIVKAFFYQYWWFYLLCSIPFILFAVAWVRRQRKIKSQLTIEVASATEKLRADKVLIESQAEKLQELDELKSKFFTNISHEFRTPLSVIQGLSQTMSDLHPDRVESSAKLIEKNSNLLLDLINQILDLVKLEAGQLQPTFIQTEVVRFLNSIVEGLQPLAEAKGISLEAKSDTSELFMDIDQDKLVRIVLNLVGNAVKFTESEGQISVAVKSENGELVFSVEDTGRGIAKENLPFVFDRFYQVDSSTTREGEGTGIGLNFTKELVELLGGTISVRSQLGIGSVFTVRLPISKKAQLVAPKSISFTEGIVVQDAMVEPEAVDDSVRNPDRPSLLIVEDNQDITSILLSIFSKEYQVHSAENGQIGIDKAKELVPDFILSDVMMPKKDGVELVDELKNEAITSHVPIVLLTAKADISSRIEGLRRGADDYISKPFHPEELSLKVRNILTSKQRIRSRYELGAPKELSTNPEFAPEDEFISRIQDVLNQNLDDSEFGIKDFCRELGVSRMQLHNKLKALTGLSTSHYIRSLRLDKSLEYINDPSLNISELGYKVGFSSHAYFSKSFSQKFGKSPSQYKAGLS